ncbi:MAG: hypothetical protein N4A53_09840 [Pelagimonas sp.]|nr:hypothetical protein [Pelagimonas sp.]
MPIRSTVVPEKRLLYTDYTGSVSALDIANAYQEFLVTPGADKVKFCINDLSRLETLKVFFDASAAMASMIASDGDHMADPWEIAIISDNLGHYALLLEYAARVNDTSSVRCAVHKSIPLAIDWFGLRPADLRDALPHQARTAIDGAGR